MMYSALFSYGFLYLSVLLLWMPGSRSAVWGFALLIAAILFGLAHYAGGTKYVILATVAGMGYGCFSRRNLANNILLIRKGNSYEIII